MKIKHKLLYLLLIVTFLGCTENNYYTADGLGKVNVYIEGDITNEEAVEKLKTEVGSMTENIYVRNTTALTNIVINTVVNMQNIEVSSTESLTNIVINAKGSLYDIKVKTNKNLAD